MKYYISDLHFGHTNILRLSNRPFKTIEEQEAEIIKLWNAKVGPEDEVYILGDVSYKNSQNIVKTLKSLNGRKHLIVGNHDSKMLKNKEARECFESIQNYLSIVDGTTKVIIFHYPICEWDRFFRGSVHLYGHIHNNTKNDTYKIMSSINNAYNVGADVQGFVPCTLKEIILMKNK